MTTGFTQRFKGKIAAQTIYLGTGGIVDAASGIRGGANLANKLTIAVTATANTDFTMSLPTGAAVIGITVFTTTAFGAATDAKIQIGASAGDNAYVAATSIKAAGVVALTLASAVLAALPAAPNLFVRVVQSGAASATGAATMVVEYAMP